MLTEEMFFPTKLKMLVKIKDRQDKPLVKWLSEIENISELWKPDVIMPSNIMPHT